MITDITTTNKKITKYFDALCEHLSDAATYCLSDDASTALHYISAAEQAIEFLQLYVQNLEDRAQMYKICFDELDQTKENQ